MALRAAPDEKPVMLMGAAPCSEAEARSYPAANRQEQSFIQSRVDAIPSPVFYRDRSGIFVLCNEAFEEFLKRPKDQIIGKTVYEVFSRKIAAQQHRTDMDLFRHPGVHVYESVIPVNGQVRHTIVNQTTYFAVDDEMAGIVGVIVDLTDQKDLETQLDAQNRLPRTGQTKSVKPPLFAPSTLQYQATAVCIPGPPASDKIESWSLKGLGKVQKTIFVV
jgi:PAS domain S-box-containing protein